MKDHLNKDQLIGYIYRTLADAERESMDDHLIGCQQCRARLAYHETLHRRIHHELRTALKSAEPASQMSFAAIGPRLKRRSSAGWGQSLFSGATATVTLAGLAIALVSLWQVVAPWLDGAFPLTVGPLPALATFCFALTVIGQFEWRSTAPRRFMFSAGLAFLLWLGTAVVGLQVIIVIWDLFMWGFVQFGGSAQTAVGLSGLVLVLTSLIYIAIVVGGGEYHYKRIGQLGSWLLFGWTVAAELLLLVLHHLIF